VVYVYVGFEVLTAMTAKSSISLDKTPCSPLKVNRRFISTKQAVSASSWFVSSLAYSSNLKMEATCSSDTLVDFQENVALYPRRQNSSSLCMFIYVA
jgi:hypothetical protein